MKKTIKQSLVLSAAALMLIPTLAGCANKNEDVIAIYDGGAVTKQDAYDTLKFANDAKTQIQSTIMLSALEHKFGDKVDKKQIDDDLKTYKSKFSKKEWKMLLRMNKSSEARMKRQAYLRDLQNKSIESIHKISEKDYKNTWDKYKKPLKVQQILVSTEDQAKKVIERLNNGDDFNTVLKEESIEKNVAKTKGKVKEFNSFSQDVDSAFVAGTTKQLKKVGDITQKPVHSSAGYHVVKLNGFGKRGTMKEHKKELKRYFYDSYENSELGASELMRYVVNDMHLQIKDKDLSDMNILVDSIKKDTIKDKK